MDSMRIWESLRESRRVFILCVVALLFAVVTVYAASLDNPFTSDDYYGLAVANSLPKNFGYFFTNRSLFPTTGQYPVPLMKLLRLLEFTVFGANAGGFHLVSLLLHLTNILLVIFLFTRLLHSRWSGLLVGLFFGLSASHWRVTMWEAAQTKLLGALFLLLAVLSFLSFLQSGRWRFAAWTACAQGAMLFSSGMGVELPALFLLFAWAVGWPQKPRRKRFWEVLGILACLSVLYVVLQVLFFLTPQLFLLVRHDVLEFVRRLSLAGWWIAVGSYEGIFRSFTGIYIGAMEDFTVKTLVPVSPFLKALPLLPLAILLLWPKHRGNLSLPLFLCLGLWVLLLYFPPTLSDIAQGFNTVWFATRSRYLYLPAIPASAMLVQALTSLRLPRKEGILRTATVGGLLLFFLWVLSSNIRETQLHEQYVDRDSRSFAIVRDVLVTDLRALLRKESVPKEGAVATIVDEPLGTVTGYQYAAHNVYPSTIAMGYLQPSEWSRFVFLKGADAAQAQYWMGRDGHLIGRR